MSNPARKKKDGAARRPAAKKSAAKKAAAPAAAKPAAAKKPAQKRTRKAKAAAPAATPVVAAAAPAPAAPTADEIRERAHTLWVAGGRRTGRALADWLQAERELRSERV